MDERGLGLGDTSVVDDDPDGLLRLEGPFLTWFVRLVVLGMEVGGCLGVLSEAVRRYCILDVCFRSSLKLCDVMVGFLEHTMRSLDNTS